MRTGRVLGHCRGWEQGSGGPLTPEALSVSAQHCAWCYQAPHPLGEPQHLQALGRALSASSWPCILPGTVSSAPGPAVCPHHPPQQPAKGSCTQEQTSRKVLHLPGQGTPPFHNFLAPVASTPHIHGPEWKVQHCLEELSLNLWHLCLNLGCAGGLSAKLLPSY